LIVMPANSTGWFWHCLARETGRIGHLYSPGAQRGPFPWFPFALDNGAFSCWDRHANVFDFDKWNLIEPKWQRMIEWAGLGAQTPRWAIVPDVPGNAEATLERWGKYVQRVHDCEINAAIAVQDGMTVEQVKALRPGPVVICVGGTDEFKWGTLQQWTANFPRVHVLRVNQPDKLNFLESLGVESCDGTGWNRGNRKQTKGVEEWARNKPTPTQSHIWRWCCRSEDKQDELFSN
jgi:hypothetical protein